ncbi:uncharacterized protein B0P05DRAFT_564512 [Gilbertella persicaria]|uniref:uncharacterized protein n=1 Tax=Gilbertella persicaria TaxID=101096 RepID=UPI00221FF6B4|nr:uncharacterized protein B0P05DRAFT_564512 [Gilbertella persicaria]KAI8048336.1 hypothetical protein B0P05DRAFT_564512 [Gilbertella persicaria]
MRTIPEELIQYRLPRAQNQFIIDLITTLLLRVPLGTYKAGDNMFIDGTVCEALYIPHSSDLVGLPPVVAEIQHTVTREFMCRAVQYCLNVYKRFHILSILFIVCTSKTKFKTLRGLFKSVKNKSNLLETPCCHFATGCFMLTKQSIHPFIDNHDTKKLDPLVVFVHFLTSGQQNIITIDRWDNPTNTRLYFVTMEMVKNNRKTENDKVEALQTICQATQNQFERIRTTVFDNPSRAHQYAEVGRHYSASLEVRRNEARIKQYTSRSNNTNGAS